MAPDRACRGTKPDGSPCGAPRALVDPDTGFCRPHDPAQKEAQRAAARRGAEATRRKWAGKALADDDLPPLTSHRAAEAWAEVIGRAVATGTLSATAGSTALRAVKEWREAHEAGAVSERLDTLMQALATWRKTGDAGPVLELTSGGKT